MDSVLSSRDENEAADYLEALEQIADDVQLAVRDLSSEERNGFSVTFCVDFESIYSALELLAINATASVWNLLAFDAHASRMVVLPGSLTELSRYLNRRDRTRSQGRDLGAIGAALIQALDEENADPDYASIALQYQHVIDRFRDDPIADKYLHFLLTQRFTEIDSSALQRPDLDVFFRAAYWLTDRRPRRFLNNRVDALDFGICARLNEESPRRKYRIMSSAATARGVAQFLEGHGTGVQVRSARQVGVRELLLRAAGTHGGARQLGWLLKERIETRIRELDVGFDRSSRWPTSAEAPLDDVIFDLLSQFDEIDEAIAQIKGYRARVVSALRDPEEIRAAVLEAIDAFMRHPAVATSVETWVPSIPPPARIELEAFEGEEASSTRRRVRVMAGDNPVAVGMVDDAKFILSVEKKVSLESFLALISHTWERCAAYQAIGWRAGASEGREIRANNETGVYVRFDGPKPVELDVPIKNVVMPLSANALAREADRWPGDIKFVRIDGRWFAASFEDGYCSIATHAPIYNEAAFFVAEMDPGAIDSQSLSSGLRAKLEATFGSPPFAADELEQEVGDGTRSH